MEQLAAISVAPVVGGPAGVQLVVMYRDGAREALGLNARRRAPAQCVICGWGISSDEPALALDDDVFCDGCSR